MYVCRQCIGSMYVQFVSTVVHSYLYIHTYIHTYITPLGGLCMYVCMYVGSMQCDRVGPSLTKFDHKSAEFSSQCDRVGPSFDQVLTGNIDWKSGELLEKSLQMSINRFKSVFFATPSVKHFKKVEKGGFLEFSA